LKESPFQKGKVFGTPQPYQAQGVNPNKRLIREGMGTPGRKFTKKILGPRNFFTRPSQPIPSLGNWKALTQPKM